MNVVGADGVVLGGGRVRVERLVEVQIPRGARLVVVVAARVVGAPPQSGGDPRIGHVVDLVVRDDDARRIGEHDPGEVPVVDPDVVNEIVLDGQVLVDEVGTWIAGGAHLVAARMVRPGLDAPDDDSAAGDLREHAAGHVDAVGPQPDARRVRAGVVADPEPHLAEVDEPIPHEGNVLRRGYLDGGGHLQPVRPRGLEHGSLASAREVRPGTDEKSAGLLIGESVGVRLEPAGVREREAAEDEIVGWLGVRIASGGRGVGRRLRGVGGRRRNARGSIRRARRAGASHDEQKLQLRELDVDLRQVLARGRDVVRERRRSCPGTTHRPRRGACNRSRRRWALAGTGFERCHSPRCSGPRRAAPSSPRCS